MRNLIFDDVMKATLPANEDKRLETLRNYDVLGTLPEQAYDDITYLASLICGTPIALMSLVGEDSQWFKSRVGIDVESTPRELSFCAHAILDPQNILVVPDATRDERFADNDLVTGFPQIRFYAGAPLVADNGDALGTICVIDSEPHQMTAEQEKALSSLARQVMAQLELRRQMAQVKRAEQKLRSSEQRFNAFMDNSPTVAFMKDSKGRFVYANDAMLQNFGKTRKEILGKTDFDLWPDAAADLREHDQVVMSGDTAVQVEEDVPSPDGVSQHWLSIKFPLQDGHHRLLGGVAINITERKHYEMQLKDYQHLLEESVERLQELSVTDALTGLRNRGAFEIFLAQEVKRASESDACLSMLMLDVDKFKSYNDEFGHPAGDDVLRNVAQAIRDNARPGDFLARYGGEEFSLLLLDTNAETACRIAERLRKAIGEATQRFRNVSASIGVATLDNRVLDGSALVQAADMALYRAKRHGRNRIECATEIESTPVLAVAS